jgi:antirestriction protein ArdC
MKVKDIIIRDLIKGLEKGELPWDNPVLYSGMGNPVTGNRYSLLNAMWLRVTAEMNNIEPGRLFMTMKQADALGGSVKSGSKAFYVSYFKLTVYTKKDTKTGETETGRFPIMRYYKVFRLQDIVGIPAEKMAKFEKTNLNIEPDAGIEKWIEDTGARIRNYDLSGESNHYNKATDVINLYPRKAFRDNNCYYSTVLHELIHWTGAENRLNRKEMTEYSSATDKRAKEELTAEIGAVILKNLHGLKKSENNQAYINSWISYLKNNPNEIIAGAGRAEKAVKFLTEKVEKSQDIEKRVDAGETINIMELVH